MRDFVPLAIFKDLRTEDDRDALVKFGDAFSFMLLLDKVRREKDLPLLRKIICLIEEVFERVIKRRLDFVTSPEITNQKRRMFSFREYAFYDFRESLPFRLVTKLPFMGESYQILRFIRGLCRRLCGAGLWSCEQ
jgi:hypothetical protein